MLLQTFLVVMLEEIQLDPHSELQQLKCSYSFDQVVVAAFVCCVSLLVDIK